MTVRFEIRFKNTGRNGRHQAFIKGLGEPDSQYVQTKLNTAKRLIRNGVARETS
jgi:hypothetical protein